MKAPGALCRHFQQTLYHGLRLGYLVLPHAIAADVALAAARALSTCARAPVTCNGLVPGYGNMAEESIDQALRRLVVAVDPC